jgi:hypothetical protein
MQRLQRMDSCQAYFANVADSEPMCCSPSLADYFFVVSQGALAWVGVLASHLRPFYLF